MVTVIQHLALVVRSSNWLKNIITHLNVTICGVLVGVRGGEVFLLPVVSLLPNSDILVILSDPTSGIFIDLFEFIWITMEH